MIPIDETEGDLTAESYCPIKYIYGPSTLQLATKKLVRETFNRVRQPVRREGVYTAH